MNRLFPQTQQNGIVHRTLELPGYRKVSLRELGDLHGRPVVALHGTPGSSARFAAAHDTAAAMGIHLIALDRWGYGATSLPSAPPGEITLRDYASDLDVIASQFGIDQFALLGVSGGAPYAAVAAAVLPGRINRLALVSPVGPVHGRNASGIGHFHALCFRTLPRVPGALRTVYGTHRLLTRLAPDLAVRFAAARAPPFDKAVIADPVMRRNQARAFAEGLSHGTAGAVLDMQLFAQPWSVAADTLPATKLWIGARDANVPLTAAVELSEDTKAQLTIIPEAGHFWLSTAWEQVLGWLAATGDP